MDAYLLGTQTLVELARRSENPVMSWARSVEYGNDNNQVWISVISIGEFRSEIESLPASDPAKENWRASIDNVVRVFSERQRLVHVTPDIAESWSKIRLLDLQAVGPDDQLESIGAERSLVAATAMARSLTLVEAEEPYHEVLGYQGLKTLDPYQ